MSKSTVAEYSGGKWWQRDRIMARGESVKANVTDPFVSAVVPCFNEDAILRELYRRLTAVCRKVCGGDYEIVLVDDGSRDQTWPTILELARGDGHLVPVRLTRNHGHQLALTAGLELCRGQRIFILDADLQDPPELLPDMMAIMDEGAHVVYGQRLTRDGETLFKKATASLFYRLLNTLVDVKIPVDTGDFRLISRKALEILNAMPEHHRFIRGMVAWIGLEQRPLPYRRDKRFAGETKYPIRKMLLLALNAITSFSIVPLRIASFLGIFVSFLSVLLLGYTGFSWLVNDTVSGWTSLMTVVLVLSGVQLLVLGVIGEYLGRVFVEGKRRPLFLIEEVVRGQRSFGSSTGVSAGQAVGRSAGGDALPARTAGQRR